MKQRCVPKYWDPKKTRTVTIILICIALIFGVPAVILQSVESADKSTAEALFMAAFLVMFAALFFLTISLYYLWLSLKRYEIKANEIMSYEPLRKVRTISLKDVVDIYVVVHTDTPGRYHPLGCVVRDVHDKNKIIYYAILLKAGCPKYLLEDDMSYFIRFGGAKKYILYDFVYDRDSVLQLLAYSTATLHTGDVMFYNYHHDPAFAPYLDRIKHEELNRLYGDVPFEK